MEAQIVSTDQILELDGRRVRLWRGTTAAGVPFLAFIAHLAVDKSDDVSQFEAELKEVGPPGRVKVAPPLSTRELAGLNPAVVDLRMLT